MKKKISLLIVIFLVSISGLYAYIELPSYYTGGGCRCKAKKCVSSGSIFRKHCNQSTPFAPCSTGAGCGF